MSAEVCFVLPHAQPMLEPSAGGVFGGSEVRAWTFATALARMPGYRISVITMAQGNARSFQSRGVYVHTYNHINDPEVPRTGARMLRRFRRMLFGTHSALEANRDELRRLFDKVGADIYCAFGASDYTGLIAELCDENRRPFVLFCGSDQDLSAHHREGESGRNEYGSTGHGAWRAVNGARLVVTQTQQQERLLEERFARAGITIRNPIDMEHAPLPARDPGSRQHVLWVGKADKVKRPELTAMLASSFPSLRFRMVVNRVDEAVWRDLSRARPENVEIIESLPLERTDALFKDALVLVNTSSFEGFPNTFLQAGKHGVPILSLRVDPDGFLVASGSGIVCDGDPGLLRDGLQRLSTDRQLWSACSVSVHRYVKAKHDLGARIAELDAALKQVGALRPVSQPAAAHPGIS